MGNLKSNKTKEEWDDLVDSVKVTLNQIPMKNIHVIPSRKPVGIHFLDYHITSDEEIKDGDSVIESDLEIITQAKFHYLEGLNGKFIDGIHINCWKKIILTTDVNLIADGVQAIDDEFLQWFVKNPKCEEVETYSLGIRNGKTGESAHCKYEIIIPTEEPKQDYKKLSEEFTETLKSIPDDVLFEYAEPKQETIEEFIEREGYHEGRTHDIWEEGVREGAAWQAERMYSEEDIERAFHEGVKSKATFLEWFEQFKKQKS